LFFFSQVKNFGRLGQTKYTHLKDQDTSSKEAMWMGTGNKLEQRYTSRMAGVHGHMDEAGRVKKKGATGGGGGGGGGGGT
jgi:microfibrillar-associated protein 1